MSSGKSWQLRPKSSQSPQKCDLRMLPPETSAQSSRNPTSEGVSAQTDTRQTPQFRGLWAIKTMIGGSGGKDWLWKQSQSNPSLPNSLICREKTGNFVNFSTPNTVLNRKCRGNPRYFKKFPIRPNREFQNYCREFIVQNRERI